MPDGSKGFTAAISNEGKEPIQGGQMRIPRPQLNYANAIATIALFVALGGAAVAAGLPKKSVGPQQLKPNAVTTKALHRKAVTSAKIAPRAVTAGKLGPFAVLPGNLGNGIITTEKLGDGAVIASKIRNGSVTTNKLNNGAVATAKLGDGAVNNSKLADGSVTPSKLAPGVIKELQGKLESGETLRGVFDLGGEGKIAREGISFQFPLASAPAAAETNVLAADGTSASCPGLKGSGGQTPEAAAGQLCVYVKSQSPGAEKLAFDDEAVTRLGFGLKATLSGSGDQRYFGYWAVTAP
ncbi:MAG TPA: hypothetical protein VFN85_11505 [Solirubrobacterales bacterium]|nr:hypothetical protein [Solirubrobacterales bacterium]